MSRRGLEALIGRVLGVDDAFAAVPAQECGQRPRGAGRRRIAVALAFLAVLATMSVYFARAGSDTPSAVGNSNRPTPSTIRADTGALRAMVAGADSCSDVVGAIPVLHCTLDIAEVEYRLVGTGAVADAYRAAVGAVPDGDRRGPARCAAGHDEERAWSRPSAPKMPAGRYRCVIAQGRAEMWWTEEQRGLVVHARGNDADLARLFAWWQERGP
jgi:hypothetical protein